MTELLDGRGALQVGGDQQRPAALLAAGRRQLAGGGRLARALEADEHQDGRPACSNRIERVAIAAHQLDQLVVDDLDDLLAGPDALSTLGADRLLADAAP